MIAFGTAVASEARYRARALPGIRSVAEPDSLVLAPPQHSSLHAAYNQILDQARSEETLEGLVLLHEDVEIVDEAFFSKLRRLLAEPGVAVIGVVGARGVRGLAWWEADCVGAVATVDTVEAARPDLPNGSPEDVDVVDGLLMALSPWAVRELRFDESFAPDFYGYDVDFCLQARALGRRVVVDGLAVVRHDAPAPQSGEQWVRSAVALERKWGGSWAAGTGPGGGAANITVSDTRRESPTVDGSDAHAAGDAIDASNIVWLFSSGRSGGTWLSSMMAEMVGHTVWHEPTVGALFGNFYYDDPWIGDAHRSNPLFILGSRREIWVSLVRSFFLDAARAMFPDLGRDGTLVVRETYGSIGAPLLVEALPESRVVVLVRDPRDVVASSLDAFKPDNWGSDALGAESVPPYSAEEWSRLYLRTVGNAKRAYEAHEGPKALITYEELRTETLGAMERIYSGLEIAVDDRQLAAAVDKHAWEAIPDRLKGAGRFYRKGVTGGWSADLTAEQVKTIEAMTAPLLDEFYRPAVTS